MSEDAALILKRAESDDRTSSEIWEDIKERNKDIEWDIHRMLPDDRRRDE